MAVKKIYTVDELNVLTRTKTAIDGIMYEDVNGLQYLGTNQGTLLFLQRAENTPIDKIKGLSSTNVGGAIEEIAKRTSVIEGDYVIHSELTELEEDCKAFALTMAIIL